MSTKLLSRLAILTVALFAAACSNGNKADGEKPIKVKTANISPGAQSGHSISLPARVTADEKSLPAFKVAGRLSSLKVSEGDRVAAGAVIATIDDRDYRIALDAAQAEYNSIKADAERVMAIYEEGATTKSAYDRAVYGMQQITAKLDHARDQLAETVLRAPRGGIVKTVYRHSGDVIGAGMPVVEIVDDSRLVVEANLPASDYLRRTDFQSFTGRADIGNDNSAYPLSLINIADVANANQLYTIRLELQRGSGLTLPPAGTSMTVDIAIAGDAGSHANEVEVPTGALTQDTTDGNTIIYIVDEDQTLVGVNVGVVRLTDEGTAIVTLPDGYAGQSLTIVAAGAGKLRDGRKVEPIPATTATNVGGLL